MSVTENISQFLNAIFAVLIGKWRKMKQEIKCRADRTWSGWKGKTTVNYIAITGVQLRVARQLSELGRREPPSQFCTPTVGCIQYD
jgi:hypothetical protein